MTSRTSPSARHFARFLKSALAVLCILNLACKAAAQKPYPVPAPKDRTCYLFAYTPDDGPELNQICYAVSTDGRHFFTLNSGMPVICVKNPSGVNGLNTPYLMRAEDGGFFMLATDMTSSNAGDSRHGLLLMKSDDLISWSLETIHFPDRFPDMPRMQDLMTVWAPHAIYDPAVKKYLVYLTLVFRNGGNNNKIYGAYANADFTDLEGEPQIMFECNSTRSMDTAIIPFGGKYHMFFGKEKLVSDTLFPGKWSAPEPDFKLDLGTFPEGDGVYPLVNTDRYVFMCKPGFNGRWYFAETRDMKTFTQGDFSLDFSPRRGSVVPIARSELNALLKTWGTEKMYELPTQNNPVIEAFYADPGTLYAEKTGKYYIYPTHDGFPGWGGRDFQVFSSPDLKDWKFERTILTLGDDVKWSDGNAWAPCIMERKRPDGTYKYYFYFCGALKGDGRKCIGCAVADDPLGPFTDIGRPVIDFKPEGVRGGQEIDPDVFRDPVSGKYYLYWGNGYMAGAELADDMLSVKRETVKVFRPGRTFREGTNVIFRNGRYYFSWSVDDTGSPNYHVRYATADSPLGDLTVPRDNIVIEKEPAHGILGTGHHQILKVHGADDEWRIVYHRFAWQNGRVMDGPGFHREVCIDKLEFNEDGTIKKVVPTL
jgi:beta-xylosidase